MCGIAQEHMKDPEENKALHTKPWHVSVTVTKVRALHSLSLHPPLHIKEWTFTHEHFPPLTDSALFRIYSEPKLGADSCSLLCQSQHRQCPSGGVNTTR